MQHYQGNCLAQSFQAGPRCAAVWWVRIIYKEKQEQELLWRQWRLETHQQPNVQGELCGTEQVLGNVEVWQRQGKHGKEQIRPHSVSQTRSEMHHTPHPTIPPDSACPSSGKVVLQPPTKRLPRVHMDSTSPFPMPCNRRSCTDPSSPTATSLPLKPHPSARPVVSFSSQFYRILWELGVLLPPPSNSTKHY